METPKITTFNTLHPAAAVAVIGTVALAAPSISVEAAAKHPASQLEHTHLQGIQQIGRLSLLEFEAPDQKHTQHHVHRPSRHSHSTSHHKHHYSSARRHWLLELRKCESGNNYKINTGNGYYGAYQFAKPTWDSLHTGYNYPHQAPKRVQDRAIIKNTKRAPGGLATQNPGCYHKLGLSQYPPK